MKLLHWMATFALACTFTLGHAQEATLRKNLAERLPTLPKIDEVSKTPMNGLYELRMGSDVMYSDAEGSFLIQGQLIDVRGKRNLTEERLEKLSSIAFDQLPLKNAFVQVRGDGKRKLAIFADPNCGYCKRFEADLQKLENVTLYHLLYPILGDDSRTKSRHIWCAKDKAKAWNDWMLRGVAPAANGCDSGPVEANVEFGRQHRIQGTPTLFFANGTRVPGAVPLAQVEKLLADNK